MNIIFMMVFDLMRSLYFPEERRMFQSILQILIKLYKIFPENMLKICLFFFLYTLSNF